MPAPIYCKGSFPTMPRSSTSPMNSRWSVNRTLACLPVFTGLCAAPTQNHFPNPPKKDEISRKAVQTIVPYFALVDQDGEPFQFAKTRSKLVLVTFIFTTCPDLCPLLTAKFAAIQRALDANKRGDYVLLSITTDPERDTPGVLKSYAERYK